MKILIHVYYTFLCYAAMAELVDALGSGPSRGNSVDVRVILAARYYCFSSKRMPMTTVALVANGDIQNYERIAPQVAGHDILVAVDGGLNHFKALNLLPDMIIGDLDSAAKPLMEQYSTIPVKKYPRDKDYTDLELAIEEYSTPDVTKITLFAALERRTDHTLANLHLLLRHPATLSIISDYEQVFAVNRNTSISSFPGQTVSLMPISSTCQGVTTSGLKWELDNAILSDRFYSLSNVCLGDAFTVDVKNGTLLCFLVQ